MAALDHKGGFLTAHILNEPYGEIPIAFVDEFCDELGDTFLLLDRFKHRISVKFNKNRGHPLMTENWLRVREVFGTLGNRLMLFTFLGNNIFFVNVYYENGMGLNKLPSDHSYRMTMEQPRHFEVTLTNYAATGNHLKLNSDFGYYIQSIGYRSVWLYGPQGTEVSCEVLKKIREGKSKTKLGTDWKSFVQINGFVENDILRMTFVNRTTPNLIKVVKI